MTTGLALKTFSYGYTFMLGNLSEIKKLSVVIERDKDGYYVAKVPSLPGCHTQAKSLDELMDKRGY